MLLSLPSISRFAVALFVGDIVEVGGTRGKVEHVTLVSTTITTFDNKTVLVPNNSVWGRRSRTRPPVVSAQFLLELRGWISQRSESRLCTLLYSLGCWLIKPLAQQFVWS